MSPHRYSTLAAEWEAFADAIQRDLGLLPEETRAAAQAQAQIWMLAAQDLRRVGSNAEPLECAECGRRLFPLDTFASQADAVRAAIEGALAIAFARPGDALADAYGGDTRRVAIAALQHAATLALQHVRSLACIAGTCKPEGTP
jgi:hypothetical protein